MQFKSQHAPGSPLWCEALSNAIGEAVEADSVAEFREPEPGRWHLGASEIGNACSRAIWYSFHWARKVEHTGQLHRLFKRGHSEEPKFVHRLKRVGIEVSERDPETGKQYQISFSENPHHGGSLDGRAVLPFLPDGLQHMLAEFKTHNDKSFEKLLKDGVSKSKPRHFCQMSDYGRVYGYKFGLYCAINKNTDAMRWQVVPLDYELGAMLQEKANKITFAPNAPPKLSENSAHMACKMCDYRGVCHLGQPLTVNCRSCRNSYPHTHDAEWSCRRYGGPLPRDFAAKGCASWAPIQ